MTQLEKLKIKLDIEGDEQDSKLELLLDETKNSMLGYMKRKPEQWKPYEAFFDSVQLTLAESGYYSVSTRGVKSRTEGNISTTFSEEQWPKDIRNQLTDYRIVRVVGG